INWESDDVVTLTPPTRKALAPATKHRELRIRDRRNNRLVTAIEVLSPANKRGGDLVGHMKKLASYWRSRVNTIDIDLLRGGVPPYSIDEVPMTPENTTLSAYRVVMVRPQADETALWEIQLTEQLPTIPVPLSHPDAPVVLNLQKAFTEFYAYSTYPPRRASELATLRPALTAEEVTDLEEYLPVTD
ncbi:MAG: DUF4058 family protein, partial [Bacteroidota bacterium]